jgi:L-threonylcarbamoyladenylate synthase
LLRPEDAQVAGSLLKRGELVVIPTETVYGLAADATNGDAVRAIFAAKGRPQDNPLIVHVASVADALSMIPERLIVARRAIEAFAPGPLTVVVPVPSGIAPVVTAGLGTVALRVPAHAGAAAIIAAAGVPLAAPSANRSGRPSPTSFEMARWEMEGRVRAIVDGGDTNIGIESTVIDGTDPEQLRILRPGSISAEELRDVLQVPVLEERDTDSEDDALRRSPGTRYRHYQPAVPVVAFRADQWNALAGKILRDHRGHLRAVRVLTVTEPALVEDGTDRVDVVVMSSDEEFARRLYREFRRAEEDDIRILYVEIPHGAISAGLRDRILRAGGLDDSRDAPHR